MKHTAGPWRNDDGTIVAADGQIIADTYQTWDKDEMTAGENAKLIAAAPDMLALLKEIGRGNAHYIEGGKAFFDIDKLIEKIES